MMFYIIIVNLFNGAFCVCVFYLELKRNYKKNNCSKITPDLHLAKNYLRTCKGSYFLDLVLEATYILYLVPS